ncbi:MAG: Hsp20/alpha crystallin family protein [Gammaproteobacteria bacterium]
MSTEIKLKLAVGFLLLCIAGLILQGFYLWRMDQRLSGTATSSEIPESIMERLEPRLQGAPSRNTADPFSFAFGGDPFLRMQQMQQQMDSLFNSISPFGSAGVSVYGNNGQSFSFQSSSPELEFTETPDEYQVKVKTPPDHELVLNTDLEANLLTVSGSVSSSHETSSNGFASNFVSSSQFTRSFDLDKPVNELGLVTEQVGDGLLVRVPKTS